MILSRSDLEDIALAATTNFDRFCQENGCSVPNRNLSTPIDDFARKYLGLSVSYARLSSDGSICGITAYADTVFQIKEMGIVRNVPLKQNQILLDHSFLRSNQSYKTSGRRRFTLAHECAHQILFQLESDTQKAMHRDQYSPRMSYSLRELKTREDWNEWQANVLGSAILMPQQKIDKFMQDAAKGRKLKNYGNLFTYSDRMVITRLRYAFDVSKTAATIRLKDLGYIEDHPRSEYVDPLEILA